MFTFKDGIFFIASYKQNYSSAHQISFKCFLKNLTDEKSALSIIIVSDLKKLFKTINSLAPGRCGFLAQ